MDDEQIAKKIKEIELANNVKIKLKNKSRITWLLK